MQQRQLRIQIEALDAGLERFHEAWTAGEPLGEFLTFPDVETLLKTLTARRWEILRHLQSHGPMRMRELARQLGRDIKSIHRNVHALKDLGLIEECDAGIRVPYDKIDTHFVLRAEAA